MATKDYERSDSSQRALTYRSALNSLKEHKKTAGYRTQLKEAITTALREETRASWNAGRSWIASYMAGPSIPFAATFIFNCRTTSKRGGCYGYC
jgi:hypothetical protein